VGEIVVPTSKTVVGLRRTPSCPSFAGCTIAREVLAFV
jgi:hypothetical protein